MALGISAVTNNVGGIPYLARDEQEGLGVPPQQTDQIVTSIMRLLNEPNLTEHLSISARKLVEAFDIDFVASQWTGLFAESSE